MLSQVEAASVLIFQSRFSMSQPRLVRLTCRATMLLTLVASAIFSAPQNVAAQQKNKLDSVASSPPALTRTTTRRELRRFNYGGTLTLYGAPEGSITIEAWTRNEIEVVADVELRADTEEELARLAVVNGFVLDDDANHLRIITTGTHDRKFMRRVAKDFPKKLLALPWKIDYRLRVPALLDLEVYAGRGALSLGGVEGAIHLSAGEGSASLLLTGGDIVATIASGPVNIRLAARSWRGRGTDIRLARGDLTLELPSNFNADIDAVVLRTGRIENSYPNLTPREGAKPTPQSQRLRAGTGGATLSFTVVDGTLRIKPQDSKQ